MTTRARTLPLRALIASAITLAAAPLAAPVEWDNEVPALPVPLDEAGRAAAVLTGASAAHAA